MIAKNIIVLFLLTIWWITVRMGWGFIKKIFSCTASTPATSWRQEQQRHGSGRGYQDTARGGRQEILGFIVVQLFCKLHMSVLRQYVFLYTIHSKNN